MDINLFRIEKGNPDIVRESQRRRGASVQLVDIVIALDADWRKLRFELDQLNKEAKALSVSISQKKKENVDAALEVEKSKHLKVAISQLEQTIKERLKQRDEKLNSVGNLVHQSVPVSLDEANNEVVRMWGTPREKQDDLIHHHHLLHMIDGYEPEVGVEVAGHRGYYLKGWGILLNQALINYGLQFLSSKGYTPVQTPFFMRKSVMSKVAALAEFDDSLYKVSGNENEEEMYLIATSEQPCCAIHMNSSINPKSLPIKYVGYSTCFRKEAGAHGRDVWGIFRVHQFEKIEQFVLCPPDKSWDMHEEMISVSEEFYQSLGFAYRVVNIVSGELNNAAAKKYDLEAWFPTFGEYRELVSCSNCTDYQSRRLDIKYGNQKTEDGLTPFVHMLNSTLTATERTICCLLENYQTEKGIRIPTVLQPYLAPFTKKLEDPTLIPFVKPLPKGAKGAKGAQKKK
uniref:serine--tRNA ligase n=1 Tax=Arcella intermedia TaxID=1963864 RepID=A0A6B2L3X5_9EUKA|eukprot:TRINITY_DN27928_c0_g1_i1.p1 TRINITY_DN27928_c0_g1~~TRINITY_DN27928_c0_g1_i1.p1  ORF type:complete len:457 (-),score=82.53 TRINITY_DN27928_c0_g1_i1:34-1404(-)